MGLVPIRVMSTVYNTPEAYLRRAVESVLNQTFTHFEYKIIDNGCTDGSKDILEEYAAGDKRIQLLRRDKNPIVHRGFKQEPYYVMGIEELGEAEYICILDSDDWYEPDFFELAYSMAKKHNADMVVSDFELISEKEMSLYSTRRCPAGVYGTKNEIADFWVNNYSAFRNVWNKLFRFSVWQDNFKNVNWEVGIASDNFIMQNIVGSCKIIAAIGKVTHHYLMRDAASVSVTLNVYSNLVRKHVVLYNNALETLKKLDAVNEKNVERFRSVFRSGIANDDFIALTNSKDQEPKAVLDALDRMLTDKTVWDVFDGFYGYEDEFELVLDLAAYVVYIHRKKVGVTDCLAARLARVWMQTNRMKSAKKNDVTQFMDIVFALDNINRAGKVMLKQLFDVYKVPFSSCLLMLEDEVLADMTALIADKDSFAILGRLLDIISGPNKEHPAKAIYGELKKNDNVRSLPQEFLVDFPPETNLIYHNRPVEAIDALEARLNDALAKDDADSAEKILEAVLSVALIQNDGNLFISTRARRLELFTLTGQQDKAAGEYKALEEICDSKQLEEVRKLVNYSHNADV